MLLSVKINISCLVLTAPTINDPAGRVTPPAVFVAVGVQSKGFSWSDHLMKRGSIEDDPIAFVPNAIVCLSVSDTIIWRETIGQSDAAALLANVAALVVRPALSSQ